MLFRDKVILVISPHTLFALFQIMETNFAATVKLKPGAKNFGRIAKGGGEQFWTPREGGAKNFRLDLFSFNPEIKCFLVFLWVLGYF